MSRASGGPGRPGGGARSSGSPGPPAWAGRTAPVPGRVVAGAGSPRGAQIFGLRVEEKGFVPPQLSLCKHLAGAPSGEVLPGGSFLEESISLSQGASLTSRRAEGASPALPSPVRGRRL